MTSSTVISIVTYKPKLEILKQTIDSAKKSKFVSKVILVDNGLEERIKKFANENHYEYIQPSDNVGFGSAHNLAIQKFAAENEFFLILNPDVIVHDGCIDELVNLMTKNKSIVLSAPKVLNPDGTIQKVQKRLPSFKVLFGRRFFPKLFVKLFPKEFALYELEDCDLKNQSYTFPNASGCFMFFRSTALIKLQGFDERYFMYQEDIDLSRRAYLLGPVVYWPKAVITHLWARDSHKNWRLMLMNISSVLKYFAKWGFNNHSEVKVFKPYESDVGALNGR